MDFFNFVNSRDIQAYLREIEYPLSSLEAAWLVWQSRYTSLKEKHAAWNEIISSMPDCEIKERHNTVPHTSLHQFLQELMQLNERCVASFKKKEDYTVYSYCYLLANETNWNDESSHLCADFEQCFEFAADACRAYSDNQQIDGCRLRFQKKWFDGTANCIEVELTSDGDVYAILDHGACTEKEIDLLHYGFDGMWFEFPTPFSKGDILEERGSVYHGYGEGPFVMTNIATKSEHAERWAWSGDNTDMIAWGYFQLPDSGDIYSECMHSYMDLEYYRGELKGVRRVLKALGNFLKDEIDISIYSRAYHTILEEEHAKSIYPPDITDEGLVLAGLKE